MVHTLQRFIPENALLHSTTHRSSGDSSQVVGAAVLTKPKPCRIITKVRYEVRILSPLNAKDKFKSLEDKSVNQGYYRRTFDYLGI